MATDVFGIVGTLQAGVFRVDGVVAEGGFGVVYRAQHVAFRAPVALKCLKVPESMTVDERAVFLDKFREEGELLFRLSASIPAVVRPLHVDVLQLDDGRLVPFLALEWLDGEALDQIINRRIAQGKAPLTIEKLVRLLTPIASAVARAHRFGGSNGSLSVIHRDIKPENIFVADVGGVSTVKILDFGIARTKSAATLHAGRAATEAVAAFTPGYASPEQWLPKRFGQTGPWTDVWGMALSMVAALTGRQPIDGDVAAMMGTTIDETRRPTPRAEGAVVSDEIEAIFQRALAVDPRRRTQSIEEFWTQIETALGIFPSLTSLDDEAGPLSETSNPPPAETDLESFPLEFELKEKSGAAPPKPSNPGGGRISRDLEFELDLGGAAPPQKPSSPGASRAPQKPSNPSSPRMSAEAAPQAKASNPSFPRVSPEPQQKPSNPSSPRMAAEGGPQQKPSNPSLSRVSAEGGPMQKPSNPSFPRVQPDAQGAQRPSNPGAPRKAAVAPAPEEEDRFAVPLELAAPRRSLQQSQRTMARSERPGALAVSLRERLRIPAWMMGIGVVIAIGDTAYARMMGEPFTVSGVRMSWITGPLVIIGVGLAIWRFVNSADQST